MVFRRSRGVGGSRAALERAVVRDSLTPEDLARLFGMGVDVVTIDFRALVGRTGAVPDVLADLCGVPRFGHVGRGRVNAAVRARSQWLSAAGKLTAGGGLPTVAAAAEGQPAGDGRLLSSRRCGRGPARAPLRGLPARRRRVERTARRRGLAQSRAGAAGGGPAVTAGPPPVSIVIPARNEEALLPAALASALAQDYGGTTEIIVADGSDTPAMAGAVAARFPAVRVIPNPERTTPAGLNRAVRAASHAVIVRCDARCVLPRAYVRLAVATLERTGAAVVGGRQRPAGRTAFERAVSLALTTPLGAGDARWRLGGPEGPADTVYLGVFRRGALEAVGGFDAAFARNQDYELNWRLRERGETVWFDPALEVAYRPRGSLAQLARQYYGYGWWKRVMLRRHPASLRWRQLAPPLLVSGLAGSALLAAAERRRAAAAAGARGDASLVGDGFSPVRSGRPAVGAASIRRCGAGDSRMTRLRIPERPLLLAVRLGVLLLVLTPLVVAPRIVYPFAVGKAVWSRSVIEIAFALWAVLAAAHPAWRPPRSRRLLLLAAGLGVALLSAWFGVSVQRSLWSTYLRMQGVLDQAHWFAAAVVAASVFRKPRDLRALLGFLARSLIPAAEPPPVADGSRRKKRRGGARPPAGAPARPSSVWPGRVFHGLAVVCGLWALGLSGSMAALAGLLAAFAALAAAYALLARAPRVRLAAGAGAGLLGAGAVAATFLLLAAPSLAPSFDNPLLRRATDPQTIGRTMGRRFVSWEAGLAGFAERPVLGWGPANYMAPFGRHVGASGVDLPTNDHAHNMLIEEAATKGLAGLAAYLAIWGLTFAVVLRAARGAGPREQAFALFTGAALPDRGGERARPCRPRRAPLPAGAGARPGPGSARASAAPAARRRAALSEAVGEEDHG